MKQMDSLQLFWKKQRQTLESRIGPLTFKNSRVTFLCIIIILMLWFLMGTLLQDTSLDKNERDSKPVRVQVIDSHATEKTTYYTLQGTLDALQKVTLRAETTGIVHNIISDKGTRLLTGETILNLSFDARLSKLREAQALVEQRALEYANAQKLQSGKFRSKTDVASAKSRLESAQAALDQIQDEIEETKIKAPFAGTVDRRYVEIGDYVKVGDPLIDFVNLDPLLGRVYIAEKDVYLMKVGATCLIDCQGNCRTGHITFVSQIADPNTRTYAVEIQVDNPLHDIPDGITAAIKIPIETSPAHLFSPAAMAMDDKGRPGIKIVNEHNKVEFHYINILNHDETGVWVRGLPEQARIITVGQFFVQPDEIVDPVLVPYPVKTQASLSKINQTEGQHDNH